MSPLRICADPRCPNPALPGRGKCDQHNRAYERDRSARRRQRASDKQGRAVYHTAIYLRRREHVLTADPFCQAILHDGTRCPRLAEELDHITPLDRDGDPYAEANMQGLCREHHHAKTARENKQRGRQGGPHAA
jgi:5-methylcytosine-specific restriction endonuclease McrA